MRDHSEHASLSRLFPSGSRPTVVSDSENVLKVFSTRGFETAGLEKLLGGSVPVPREVVFVSCEPARVPGRQVLNSLLGDSAVMIVPLLSFAADSRAIDY